MKALVVGAGIAGASVAYFLGQAGAAVTVLDAGQHAASHVPSALINPVRGQSGQVDPDAPEGMNLTWALVGQLEAQGHHIPHGQSGVLRPVPDDKTRAKFEKNLPAALRHEWVLPAAPLAAGWAHALYLPDAGWVDGQALCEALLSASGARRVEGRWPLSAELLGPEPFSLTVLCGGSLGATWAGEGEKRTHRMGSVLRLDSVPAPLPLSFGVYLSPDGAGGVLGGTFEAPSSTWEPPRLPLESLRWLLGRGAALSDLSGVRVTGRWTGSRLSGLRFGPDKKGVWHLSGLGSKGFLLGPLLARRLVAQMQAAQRQVLGGGEPSHLQ